MAPVSGTVTYQGQPVVEGTITFYPEAGGRPAIGKLQPDGSYELSTFEPVDGALIGKYRVAVEARKVIGGPPAPKSLQEEIAQANAPPPRSRAKVVWLVPQQYASASNSGLTATVEDTQNDIDFDLAE